MEPTPLVPPSPAPVSRKSRTSKVVLFNFLAYIVYGILPLVFMINFGSYGSIANFFSFLPIVHVIICIICGIYFSLKVETRDIGKGFFMTLIIPVTIGVGLFALCFGLFAIIGGGNF